MGFWWIAAGLGLGSLVLVFAPLLRGGRAERRASHDLQVYRDQLREIDADLARGVLLPAEAEATRLEISRKLLATADAEAEETAAGAAPRALSRLAAPALALLAAAGAAGLYLSVGAPGLPDQPRGDRLARQAEAFAARPGQTALEELALANGVGPLPPEANPEASELVERLREVLATDPPRPRRIEGQRLLVSSLAGLGRFAEARVAQEELMALLGMEVTAAERVDLAELMILAADGLVSPEAEQELRRALEQAPENPRGRYYSGLMLAQAGRPDLAYDLWSRLLAEGPPDAPWVAAIDAGIDEVGRAAGLPPREAARGPTRTEVEAAGEMSAEDRMAMIGGMVDQLGARLAAEGGPAEDWAQLIRSLGVLGRQEDAAEIWAEARTAFAGDGAALDALRRAAQGAGIAE